MRSSGANGSEPGTSRGLSRRVRACCVYLATTTGLICVVGTFGLAGAITSVIIVGVSAAIVATAVWEREGRRAARRIARTALAAGLIGPAAVGLIAVFDLAGALIVLILAATTPALTTFVRARRQAAGPSPAVQPQSAPRELPAQWSRLTPDSRAPEPDLGSLDDYALCLAWRRSFVQLEAACTAMERLCIVELRQKYLDELHRRAPEGITAWLASGARASGNPLPYLTDSWRQAG